MGHQRSNVEIPRGIPFLALVYWQYHAIPGILPWQDRTQREPVGQRGRQVLRAVDGEVDLVAKQRIFDFLDEDPLTADRRERRLPVLVTGCLDDRDPAGRPASRRDPGGNRTSLPLGEPASARAKAEFA